MERKRIVITGGPGTGKTTIINSLIESGYSCMEEVSRQITLEAQKNGIEQLFVSDHIGFSVQLANGRAEHFYKADEMNDALVFFDRGIPDVPAYLNFSKSTIPDSIAKLSKNLRYDMVFIVNPWKEIYTSDNERYESFELALKIHQHLVDTYTSLNYSLIEIPFGDVTSRVNFIISCLKQENLLPSQS